MGGARSQRTLRNHAALTAPLADLSFSVFLGRLGLGWMAAAITRADAGTETSQNAGSNAPKMAQFACNTDSKSGA